MRRTRLGSGAITPFEAKTCSVVRSFSHSVELTGATPGGLGYLSADWGRDPSVDDVVRFSHDRTTTSAALRLVPSLQVAFPGLPTGVPDVPDPPKAPRASPQRPH